MAEELDPRTINFSQATVSERRVWDPVPYRNIRVIVFDENERTSYDNRRLDSALEAEVNPLACDTIGSDAACTRLHIFAFNGMRADGGPCVWVCRCYPADWGSCVAIRCAQNNNFPLRGLMSRPQIMAATRQRVHGMFIQYEVSNFDNFLATFGNGNRLLFVAVAENGVYFQVYNNDVLQTLNHADDVRCYADVNLQAMAESEDDWSDEDWCAFEATTSAEEAADEIWATDLKK
jgi:hypothetical protein